MTDPELHALHDGERDVQQRRHTPEELAAQVPLFISQEMPAQHAAFFQSLHYLAIATLDNEGRPWSTLLVTASSEDPAIGIEVPNSRELAIASIAVSNDPFAQAANRHAQAFPNTTALFAAVGIDFSNRRRNKLAGRLSSIRADRPGVLELDLLTDQVLGNCPKYITVRNLALKQRQPSLVLDAFEQFSGPLPDECKALIERASTVLLATKHTSDTEGERDMGLNQRGGSPGFVRAYEDQGSSYLVIPDHSGNRFYQSLGNIQRDGQVGVSFPDFATGDMLYVTGEAENRFDDAAEQLMPRVSLVTRIRITGAVFIRQAIHLALVGEEALSPYNPPVRYLQSELDTGLGAGVSAAHGEPVTAELVAIKAHSSRLKTFSFRLSDPLKSPLPGSFGIFSFTEHFDRSYKHMDDGDPRSLNDDLIRTWTLSSAAEFDAESGALKDTSVVDITVKHEPRGRVSSFLHGLDDSAVDSSQDGLRVPFLGGGGSFSCFSKETAEVPPKMLWIAGGAGITPFMSMWTALLSRERAFSSEDNGAEIDIVMVFAGRGDDLNVLGHFIQGSSTTSIRLQVLAFRTGSQDAESSETLRNELLQEDGQLQLIDGRRPTEADFRAIPNLNDREVFLCGPSGFMQQSEGMLKAVRGRNTKIHVESFAF